MLSPKRLAAIMVALFALAVAPAASALPIPNRPLSADGASDAVVIAPGERDATGSIPTRLGATGRARAAQGRANVPGAAVGARTVLVVRVDFDGDHLEPQDPDFSTPAFTPEGVRTRVAMASALLSAQSGGTVSLRGRSDPRADVIDWIDLPGTSASPWDGVTCDYSRVARDAFSVAHARGIDITLYHHVVLLFEDARTPCTWAGRGEMPGRTSWINGYFLGSPDVDASVIAHELGHNLGVFHASTARCITVAGGRKVMPGSCSSEAPEEYGDPFDLMGGQDNGGLAYWTQAPLMSTWHRAQLMQLPEDAQRVVTTTGTYDLGEARAGAGTRLLRIPRGAGTTDAARELVIERRVPGTDFDRWSLADPPVPDGVLVRLAPAFDEPGRSTLLDFTPDTSTNRDAALVPGDAFEDEAAGIVVRLTSIVDGRAKVEISGPGLPAPTPTPTPTPEPPAAPTPVAAVPTSTPRPVVPPAVVPRATLVRPSAARKRLVSRDGRVSVEVPGAGKLVVKAGRRTLTTAKRSRVSFTLPKALRRTGLVTIRATGGTLAKPITATLRVKRRAATLTVGR